MGVFSLLMFSFFFSALIYLMIQAAKRPLALLPVATLCLFACMASGLWVVDTYITKLYNPFSGPKVENLRKTSPPPQETGDLELSAPEIDLAQEAQGEHQKGLRAWEMSVSK